MRFPRLVLLLSVAALLAGLFPGVPAPVSAQSETASVSSRRAELEQNLAAIEAEIAAQQKVLEAKQNERVSLERDVAILDAKIQQAKLAVRARDLSIQKLTSDIGSKEATIGSLDKKLIRERQSLAQIIRKTNEIDGTTLAEIILSKNDLSAVFSDIDSFASIKTALNESFDEIVDTKNLTAAQKVSLEGRRAEEVELRTLQVLQQRKIEEQEAERREILNATKGQEKAYQDLIASKQKNAAQIRAELFTLRGTAAIPFEQALAYANTASAKTGVRPAFILGVIAEESNLGENVGTGTWRVDMHPTRDQPIFAEIMRHLGLDPDQMPVSKKPWYGYGGAMGPAQFIPSTWVLYAGYSCTKTTPVTCTYNASKDRIGKASGNQPPNPWNTVDAFTASAILLMDNGADKGTLAAERLAALRYLAGWTNATNPSYAFYGDEVMELAAKYQNLIDVLKSS